MFAPKNQPAKQKHHLPSSLYQHLLQSDGLLFIPPHSELTSFNYN